VNVHTSSAEHGVVFTPRVLNIIHQEYLVVEMAVCASESSCHRINDEGEWVASLSSASFGD